MPGRGLRFSVTVALAVSKALPHSPPLATGPDKGQASTCSRSPEPGVGRSARNGSHYQVEPAGRGRGGAPRSSPGGVPLRPGQGGRSRDAPGWLTRQRAPGPARGAPWPRRNHGFAPRLQSGAGAEAILSEAPEPAAERRAAVALGSRPAAAPSSESAGPRPLTSRAGPPRLPNAGPDLVATPSSPRPPRIRLRSDTRSPRPTPGHVSRFPVRPLFPFGRTKGPPGRHAARRTRTGRAGPEGPRAGAAVTKRLLCRPARPAAAAETAPACRAGPATPPGTR